MDTNGPTAWPTAVGNERKLAAIMFTDIVGFSRQMGADEARTLRLLDVHNQIIQQAVAAHQGTVIKTVGDAFLVDFPSVVHAVQCAQQIQAQFRTHNAEKEISRADSRAHRHPLGRHRPAGWRCVWRWGEHCLAAASAGRARHDLHLAESV